jgi:hypothetical protein
VNSEIKEMNLKDPADGLEKRKDKEEEKEEKPGIRRTSAWNQDLGKN